MMNIYIKKLAFFLLVIGSTNMDMEVTDVQAAALGLLWTLLETEAQQKTSCQAKSCQSRATESTCSKQRVVSG